MIISKFSKLISAICAIPIFALLVNQTYGAARTVTVNSANNQLLYPNAADFKNSNGIGVQNTKYICVRVNTLWGNAAIYSGSGPILVSIYACEAEIKVLASDGTLLYHVSTLGTDATQYHKTVNVHDPNCKIYFYVARPGTSAPYVGTECVSIKQKLNYTWSFHNYSIKRTADINYNSTIAVNGKKIPYSAPYSVVAIDFYPNLDGYPRNYANTQNNTAHGKIREIFTNPANTIWVSIKTDSQLQRDANGQRIWTPANLIYQDGTLETQNN